MIAPDKSLIKRWRRRAHATAKGNPAMAQRRKAVSRWNRPLDATFLRWLMPLAAFSAAYSQEMPPGLLLSVGLLWTWCVAFSRAQQWASALYLPEPLWFFYQHPLTNDAVFNHQRRLMFRASFWLAADWFAGLAGWALATGSTVLWLLAPLAASAQWAVALAIALWLVRKWPRLPYVFGSMGCWLILILVLQGKGDLVAPLFTWLEKATPVGWIVWGIRTLLAGQASGWLVIVATGGVAAWLFRVALARTHRDFRMERIFGYETSGDSAALPATKSMERLEAAVMNDGAAASEQPDLPQLWKRVRPILSEPPGVYLFSGGWLERGIARLLTSRQLTLADFFRPHSLLSWSRGWLLALGGLALARILQLLGAAPAITGGLAVVSCLLALPAFGGLWPGFSGVRLYQIQTGMNSLVPIGYGETVRLMLTVNTARVVAALPLLVLAARHGFTAEPLGLGECLDWTARTALAVLAIQPAFFVANFAKNSNDTTSRRWFGALLWCALIVGAIAMSTGGIALFIFPKPAFAYLAGAAVFVYTHLVLVAYGWFYRRGLFDLVNQVRNSLG